MRFQFSLLLLMVSLAGCGPALSKSDLGTVSFEVPKVAGSEKPYLMPQLGPPLEPSKDRHSRGLP